jgi:MFS transporter, DHA2 family, multidrug resistance protein
MIALLITDPPHMLRKTFREGLRVDFLGLGLLGVGLGFLQVILDKGERDDWFGSTFITWATVVSLAALAGLVIRELTTSDPVIDLHLFKDRNFAISTFMMYTLGVVLYGTTLLLPILLQTLMGYTAMESGLVLLPGGLVLLAVLPFVGALLDRFSPRWIIASGLVIMAAGLFELSHLDLSAGPWSPVGDWIVSRMGTAFLFVPINVMAFYFVPRGKMNNASGLINLARNVGASTGISFVTTMLDRRSQFHQNVLSENLRGGNFRYQAALHHLTQLLVARGQNAPHALSGAQALVYGELERQAMMLSFVDNFRLMGMICVCVLPLLLAMRQRKT